jgi:glyoxylase-like metal-dependent hydrolase (beta-lactamase superfamily II)
MHLKDGETLDFGTFNFEVVHTQGHSPGHVMLHDRQRKEVICGDLALGWGALVPDQALISPYYYSPDLYLAGIEKALSLRGDSYCTSHFGVLSSSGMEDLAARSVNLVHSLENGAWKRSTRANRVHCLPSRAGLLNLCRAAKWAFTSTLRYRRICSSTAGWGARTPSS